MKKIYKIFLAALGIIVLSWFLPWLYSLIFPVGAYDPFVAWSPISDSFIVTDSHEEDGHIYSVDAEGNPVADFTRNQRDSLLPQIYFNQLVAREQLPDTIKGQEVTIPGLRHSQWVFTSLQRDLNKVGAKIYMMMESMPERFELEDPEVVFRVNGNSALEFIDIATNTTDESKTRRFNEIFDRQGFVYPIKSASANVTTRKAYDEGYLMADANGDIYHVKMQASRPSMVKVNKPDSIVAAHVFILENMDTRPIGLVSDEANDLYVLEKNGYKLVKLPIGKIDPTEEKFTIIKNQFNWVFKINDGKGVRWVAIDSGDYSKLGEYAYCYPRQLSETVASFIFPFELSFTSVSDCYAKPRITDISTNAIILNIVLALATVAILRRKPRKCIAANSVVVLIFGIFAFIPITLLNE